MKLGYLIITILLCCSVVKAEISHADTTVERKDTSKNRSVDVRPMFPGGYDAFAEFITKNLKYPGVAQLIGINGKVNVQFVIDRDGKMTDVVPESCVGAGCEAEAVKVLNLSPQWTPGIQDGKPVRVRYIIPINFAIKKDSVMMRSLRNSDYGFVFEIKGQTYSIDDAEKFLGKSFNPALIEIALPFVDNDRFPFPGKKEVYCLKIKG